MGKIVTLATFNMPYSAHILQGKLEEAGIAAMLADENITTLYGYAACGVRVMVDEDDIDRAKEVLSKLDSGDGGDVKLVIFDLDGTLLNSLEDLADSANHVLALNGYPVHPVDDYRYFVGDGVRKLIERILPENCRTESVIETVKREFVDYYDIHKEDKTIAYEGLSALLSELKRMGLKVAVATNKVHHAVAPLLAKYFPGFNFDVAIGQREGIPVKPAPQIVFDIMNAAECNASETLHVGDTGTDMQLAHNAGIRCVGVTWGYRPESELVAADADYIIHKPSELLNLL